MTKNNMAKKFQLRSRFVWLGALGLLIAAAGTLPSVRTALAEATCNSIAQCQQQINEGNSAVSRLQTEATSYQDAINHLNAQIYQLQGSIDANVAQQAKLQQQIAEAQAEIVKEKKVLGTDIKAMYVNGQISTIEQLATSKNLSSFVDAQTYRNAVQNKIQATLVQIADLEIKLKDQQQQVQLLLQTQRAQQSQLGSAQAEQSRLLAYNESQQATYNAQTSQNKQKLAALIEAQRRANNDTSAGMYFLRFSGNPASHDIDNDDYPYRDSPFSMSTAPGCVDGDVENKPGYIWGYCTRQCVSYAAWAVQRSGREAPRFYGNAKDWVGAARRNGVPVYTSDPQPGDVAITTAGAWGHAMYVEKVDGGRILVSQYNQQLTGRYSTQWRTY